MNAPVSSLSRHALTDRTGETVLPTPEALRHDVSLATPLAGRIQQQRQAIRDILAGRDDRLLVIVGPCSIHDPVAALDYARRLAELAPRIDDRILPVMRVYVEKPRTTVGWKGLAYDPDLNGRGDMARGLSLSRRLMRDIAELGLPVATELLQPMLAAYLDDLLSWVAIGARTTESQLHRELASGLEAVVGFKNATSGDIGVALDAMHAARHLISISPWRRMEARWCARLPAILTPMWSCGAGTVNPITGLPRWR